MKILHFSDTHFPGPLSGGARTWLGKRSLGFVNHRLRRRGRFRGAVRKIEALRAFAEDHEVDQVLFTGDFTNFGTEAEYRHAAEATRALLELGALESLVLPGNHDLYVSDALKSGRFERHFRSHLGNDLPEIAGRSGWPRVRLLGERAAIVAVNSSRPNPQIWRSSGRIPEGQLQRLRQALRSDTLAGRTVLVATHYAPVLPNGAPDSPLHGLRNADALLETLEGHRCGLLFGHVHQRYHRPIGRSVLGFGAGSATYTGREGAWIFELEEGLIRAVGLHYTDGRWSEAERLTV